MHFIRRLIAWALYFGFFAAVGAGAFGVVRHAPRCTITGPLIHMHVSANGSRLTTL